MIETALNDLCDAGHVQPRCPFELVGKALARVLVFVQSEAESEGLEELESQRIGTPACCRLTRSGRPKPGICRRSGLRKLVQAYFTNSRICLNWAVPASPSSSNSTISVDAMTAPAAAMRSRPSR